MIAIVFLAIAAAVGVAQARSLARAARGAGNAFAPLARLLAVGAVLAGAAYAGALLAAILGWLAGFAIAVLVIARRWR